MKKASAQRRLAAHPTSDVSSAQKTGNATMLALYIAGAAALGTACGPRS